MANSLSVDVFFFYKIFVNILMSVNKNKVIIISVMIISIIYLVITNFLILKSDIYLR